MNCNKSKIFSFYSGEEVKMTDILMSNQTYEYEMKQLISKSIETDLNHLFKLNEVQKWESLINYHLINHINHIDF